METDLRDLRTRRAQFRTGVLASLLMFAIVLWLLLISSPAGIPAAVAACLLYLAGIRRLRGRYRRAYMRMYALYGAGGGLRDAGYTFNEPSDAGLLARLNLTPGVEYWARPVYRHVLRGRVKGVPAMMAEVAFTRRAKNGLTNAAVSGTLIRMATDGPCRFAAIRGDALPWKQCYAGYAEPPAAGTEPLPPDAHLLTEDGRPLPPALMRAVAKLLRTCDGPVCIASSAEGVAVLLPHRFYTENPDYTREPSETDFQLKAFPELEPAAEIATEQHDAGRKTETETVRAAL